VLNSEWDDFRWGPVAPANDVPSLVEPTGYFTNDPDHLKNADGKDAKLELTAQIERARRAGIGITHLDSHMLALLSTPTLFRVYDDLGHEYKLPILLERQGPVSVPGGAVPSNGSIVLDKVIAMDPGISDNDWVTWYEKTLAVLPPGVYQLVLHLAYDDDEMRAVTRGHPDWGAAWRQRDLNMVRSPEFQKFLRDQGFTLLKWSDINARHVNSR
ncbi:MAG: ChbG/HpnK family deacetylase, partial [Acidobacteriaceae bacterium]|nr:ChbG/HpnK family deacetylase [Acidobacteriaceae bacterium]